MDFAKLLAFGVSGLGLSLAILAYRLLLTEQKIVKPRTSILRAIYIFMAFALVLTGVGLVSELFRSVYAPRSQAPEPVYGSSFHDVLKATRQKLVGDAPHQEYNRGALKTGESSEFAVSVLPGLCKKVFVFADRPASIRVLLRPAIDLNFSQFAAEPHMLFGSLCAAKSPNVRPAVFEISMLSDGGERRLFVAEAYAELPGRQADPAPAR